MRIWIKLILLICFRYSSIKALQMIKDKHAICAHIQQHESSSNANGKLLSNANAFKHGSPYDHVSNVCPLHALLTICSWNKNINQIRLLKSEEFRSHFHIYERKKCELDSFLFAIFLYRTKIVPREQLSNNIILPCCFV